ncbi:Pyruvate formate-lyase [Salmonella enterica subsp. enterica]|uniref:Pyruvate formate-lyase n=1 Tax=Salmonella enterica I TaxID=59201 RepID=A0A379X4S7_SALET|nr:Pyruvate formate-lyase [Salmonella enterica subsp. enterica]
MRSMGWYSISQRLSFDALLSILKNNFATPEGEKIRARLINRFEKYGNDIDNVDNISAELLRYYCKEVEKYQNPRGGQFTPGSYTVSAHVPLERWSARHRTGVLPENSWRMAACRRCSDRICKGRRRY